MRQLILALLSMALFLSPSISQSSTKKLRIFIRDTGGHPVKRPDVTIEKYGGDVAENGFIEFDIPSEVMEVLITVTANGYEPRRAEKYNIRGRNEIPIVLSKLKPHLVTLKGYERVVTVGKSIELDVIKDNRLSNARLTAFDKKHPTDLEGVQIVEGRLVRFMPSARQFKGPENREISFQYVIRYGINQRGIGLIKITVIPTRITSRDVSSPITLPVSKLLPHKMLNPFDLDKFVSVSIPILSRAEAATGLVIDKVITTGDEQPKSGTARKGSNETIQYTAKNWKNFGEDVINFVVKDQKGSTGKWQIRVIDRRPPAITEIEVMLETLRDDKNSEEYVEFELQQNGKPLGREVRGQGIPWRENTLFATPITFRLKIPIVAKQSESLRIVVTKSRALNTDRTTGYGWNMAISAKAKFTDSELKETILQRSEKWFGDSRHCEKCPLTHMFSLSLLR